MTGHIADQLGNFIRYGLDIRSALPAFEHLHNGISNLSKVVYACKLA